MYTRREFGKVTLASLAAAAVGGAKLGAIDSTIGGVKVGSITYSFRGIPRPDAGDYMDTFIRAFTETGLGFCELESVRVEPPPGIAGGGRVPSPLTPEYTKIREELKQWRLAAPMDRFREIRAKFDKAGIQLMSYVFTFAEDGTPAEREHAFRAAQALGVNVIGSNQTRTFMGKELAPLAEKYGIAVSWHNHANVKDPTEVGSVESFKALFSQSKMFKANLDIGHFVAGNNDPIAFIRQYHDRITHLHLKDRRRDGGPNVAWGQGETPIADVLRLLQKEKYPIYAIIEYEHMGERPPVEEVNMCVAYIRKALGA
jgi:sugar phosphate isomerase/epimerase